MHFGLLDYLSIIFWVSGYLQTRFPFENSLVNVPKWLFILCGAPKGDEFPAGVLSSRGLTFQLAGFLSLFYAYVIEKLLPYEVYANPITGILVSFIIATLVVYLLDKYYG
jgi:hypothetical protein